MPGRGNASRLRRAREDSTSPADHLASLERARRRLEGLFEISKLLLRFDSVDRTVPEVVTVIADVIPLHSALFILTLDNLSQTITWLAEGRDARRLQEARTHAEGAYRHLVRSDIGLGREPMRTLALPEALEGANDAEPRPSPRFVMLPLVVGHGPVFGALQIEGASRLNERDLVFVNAVVNQLAIGLNRYFADRALRRSEAKLAGLVSIASDAIIWIDDDQHIVLFNEGAEAIFGYSRSEIVGAPLEILIPERFRAIHRQHVERLAAGSDVSRPMTQREGAPVFGLRKSGDEFPADAAISKLEVGGERALMVVLRDITEQKRVEREQSFLARIGAVLATTLEYEETLSRVGGLAVRELAEFCLIDILEENGELRRLVALSRDPAEEWVTDALLRVRLDRSRPHPILSVLDTKKTILIETVTSEMIASWAQSDEHLRALRTVAPRSAMAVPLLARGRLLGVLTLASSNRAFGPADLHLAEELAHRAALATDNARLYLAAKSATQMRDDVLGVVAHDLRNPLGTIVIQASRLRRRGLDPERCRELGATIERAANRMNRLIQDLLDVTSMEAGHLSIEQSLLPTGPLVSEAMEAQRPLASSASLELRLDLSPDLPDVWADRDGLLQVFENLIGNALKFTEPGGRVTVGAALRDSETLFWVADTGIGIAAEDVPHLFDRFWQARKGGKRGAGLGLPIVKGIVLAHGGRIWVESTRGHGSTFFFTIPAPPRSEAWRAEPAPQGR